MIMASGLAIFFKFLTLEGLCNRQVMTKFQIYQNSEIDLSIERTRKSALQFYINVNKNSISDRRSWNQGQWKISDAEDIGSSALWVKYWWSKLNC